jgi:hypothetical protein
MTIFIKRIKCYFLHRKYWCVTGWLDPYTDYTCQRCNIEWWIKNKRIGYQKQWDKR